MIKEAVCGSVSLTTVELEITHPLIVFIIAHISYLSFCLKFVGSLKMSMTAKYFWLS